MPYIGQGVNPSLNPGVTPTFIFSPNGSATCNLRLSNSGNYPVYVGGANVSQFNGFPIPPGSRPVEIQNAGAIASGGALYAAAQVFASGPSVVTNSAVSGGVTSFTVTTTGLTANTLPFPVILGNSPGQEVVFCTALTGNTVLTLSQKTTYDHATGCTVATAVGQYSVLNVTSGVV